MSYSFVISAVFLWLDFVLVTTAFSPELRHLFNKETFSQMKPSSIFINTSRGTLSYINRYGTYLSILKWGLLYWYLELQRFISCPAGITSLYVLALRCGVWHWPESKGALFGFPWFIFEQLSTTISSRCLLWSRISGPVYAHCSCHSILGFLFPDWCCHGIWNRLRILSKWLVKRGLRWNSKTNSQVRGWICDWAVIEKSRIWAMLRTFSSRINCCIMNAAFQTQLNQWLRWNL